jgi:hypothetical protein
MFVFSQHKPEIHCSELLCFSLDVSCENKGLGRPASCSINGKHFDKYFKPKPRHAIIFQENINNWCKELIRKYNDKKLSHLVMGNQLNQLKEEFF